jgi:uncharacterized protein YceK
VNRFVALIFIVMTVMLSGCADQVVRAATSSISGSDTAASVIADLRDRLASATTNVDIERAARQKAEVDLKSFKDNAAGWRDRAEATSHEASVLSEQASSLRARASTLEAESKALEKKATDERVTAERKLTEERIRLVSRFGMALSSVVFAICCIAAWFLPLGAGKKRALIGAASMVVLFAVSYSAPTWVPIAIKIGIVVAGLAAVVTVIILIRALIQSVRSTADHGDRVEDLLVKVASAMPDETRQLISSSLDDIKKTSSTNHGRLGNLIDKIRGKT